jgi:polysaccharide biosynthesis transport protein
MLRKRRRVIVVAALLGLAYGPYKAESQPKLFELYRRIQVPSGSSNEYKVSAVEEVDSNFSTKLTTEIGILKSDSLGLQVAGEMDLSNNARFLEAKGPIPHTSMDTPEVSQATVHRLLSNLQVNLVPKTAVIRISYSSLSPKPAANIVTKVIATSLQRSYETRFTSHQRVSDWLSSTLDDLKQQIETSHQQIMEMERWIGILGFGPAYNQISTSLGNLATVVGTAKLSRSVAEARYRTLSGMAPDTIEGSIETTPGTSPGVLNTLRGQIAEAKATDAQMEATLGPNHPQAKAAKAQIDEPAEEITAEQNRLPSQAKQNFTIARGNEEQTMAALEAPKADASKLRDVEYTRRAGVCGEPHTV